MNAKNIFHFSIGPIGAAALGFITLPIITWFFSAEDIGRLTMFRVAISFSVLLFSLGMDQAYVREYNEVQDKASLLKTTLLPSLVVLGVVLIALAFTPWSISQMLFGIDSVYLTCLLLLGIVSSLESYFLSLILRMQERGLAFSMGQLLPKLLFLIIISSYIIFSVGASFANLMLAHVISLLVVLLIYIFNTRNQWLPAIGSIIDKQKLNQMIRYGLPLIAGGLAFWGLTAMDRFFLRSLSSFSELGVYAVSVSFAAAASIISTVFSNIWHPQLYRWVSEGVEFNKVKSVSDTVLVLVLVSWSFVGMLSWVVKYFLPFEYEHVPYIMIVCMVYPYLYVISETTGVGIGIKRRSIYSMVATILALITNAILNYILIPNYGANGAAIASALAFYMFLLARTEFSAMLWVRMLNFKGYFIVSAYVSFSIIYSFTGNSLSSYAFVWALLLAISLVLYKKSIIEIKMYLMRSKGV